MARLVAALRYLAILAGGVAILCPAQSSQAFKTYSDPEHGVSFRYPAMWEMGTGMIFYMGTAVLTTSDGPTKAIAAVGFYGGSGEGYRPYPHSDLSGIQFAYTVRDMPDSLSCEKIARETKDDEANHEGYEVIHGVRYLHVTGGSAGLGHGVNSETYAVFRGGSCYLFEEDIHTRVTDGEDGATLLTEKTRMGLRAALEGVMRSVRMR